MDPNAGAQQMAQMLEDGTHPLQAERDLGPIELWSIRRRTRRWLRRRAGWMRRSVTAGFVHTGDRRLRQHVLNAVRKTTGVEEYRFDRPRDARTSKYPIDLLTGLLMGHNVAVDEVPQPKEPMAAWI
jgi:hypothetical protein